MKSVSLLKKSQVSCPLLNVDQTRLNGSMINLIQNDSKPEIDRKSHYLNLSRTNDAQQLLKYNKTSNRTQRLNLSKNIILTGTIREFSEIVQSQSPQPRFSLAEQQFASSPGMRELRFSSVGFDEVNETSTTSKPYISKQVSQTDSRKVQKVRKLMKNDSFVGKMHHLIRNSANFQMSQTIKTDESLVDQNLFKKIADSPEKLRLRLNTDFSQTNEQKLSKSYYKIDKQREDGRILYLWMKEKMRQINEEQVKKEGDQYEYLNKMRTICNTTMTQISQLLREHIKEFSDIIDAVWKSNNDLNDQLLGFINKKYETSQVQSLVKESRTHQAYHGSINQLTESLNAEQIDKELYRSRYRELMVTDRYLRKKTAKLEKINEDLRFNNDELAKRLDIMYFEHYQLLGAVETSNLDSEESFHLMINKFKKELTSFKKSLEPKPKLKPVFQTLGTMQKIDLTDSIGSPQNKSAVRSQLPQSVLGIITNDSHHSHNSRELEQQIFMRNDADLSECSINIADMGVNTSAQEGVEKFNRETQVNVYELQTVSFMETQTEPDCQSKQVQCNIPITLKPLQLNYKDVEYERFSTILKQFNFLPNEVVSLIFEAQQKTLEIKQQVIQLQHPTIATVILQLQNIITQIAQRSEGIFMDSQDRLEKLTKDLNLQQKLNRDFHDEKIRLDQRLRLFNSTDSDNTPLNNHMTSSIKTPVSNDQMRGMPPLITVNEIADKPQKLELNIPSQDEKNQNQKLLMGDETSKMKSSAKSQFSGQVKPKRSIMKTERHFNFVDAATPTRDRAQITPFDSKQLPKQGSKKQTNGLSQQQKQIPRKSELLLPHRQSDRDLSRSMPVIEYQDSKQEGQEID